jgi:hypothetical protein
MDKICQFRQLLLVKPLSIRPTSSHVVRASRPQSRERPAPARGQSLSRAQRGNARSTAGEKPAPRRRPYAGAITLEMAATNCFHFDFSRANCFLPVGVKR